MRWRWQWPWTTPAERSTADEEKAAPDPEAEYAKTLTIDGDKRYLLQNRTPRWVRIVDDEHGEVLLSPLGARVMTGWRLRPFVAELRLPRQRHQLRIREYCHQGRSRWPGLVVPAAFLGLVGLAVHRVVVDGTLKRPYLGFAAIAAVVLVGVVLVLSTREERRRRDIEESSDMEEGDIDFGVGGTFYDGNETLRRTKHLLALATVLVVGVALPAVAIFLATDAKTFIQVDGGLAVVDGSESPLVGRLIQVTYTAVLSLFPALLYFQFDLHRVGTIRADWVRAIFRMDRRMETLADVNARYGDDLSEASSYSTDSARFLGGRNSPIIIATLLVSLGWTLLVAGTASFDFARTTEVSELAQSAQVAAARADGADSLAEAGAARAAADDAGTEAERVLRESMGGTSPSTTTTAPARSGSVDAMEREAAAAVAAAERAALAEQRIAKPFFEFLVPTPSAAAMAFLGAYFFGIYLLLRSYFRGDLRPKLYNQITARLITVVVLAYLINALFYDQLGGRNRLVWALSFLAGVIPTTVLQQTGRLVSQGFGALWKDDSWLDKAFKQAFGAPRALTQIDGIDIHDSTRLETEGLTDIPSLAKGDIVSAMVKTRLPVERLIDWTDQALLLVHLDDEGDEVDQRVKELRAMGIRTASAILAAEKGELGDGARDAIDGILAGPCETEAGVSAGRCALNVSMLAAQIRREPTILPILSWRDSPHDDIAVRSTMTIRTVHGVVEVVRGEVETDAPVTGAAPGDGSPDEPEPAGEASEVDLRRPTSAPEPDMATVD